VAACGERRRDPEIRPQLTVVAIKVAQQRREVYAILVAPDVARDVDGDDGVATSEIVTAGSAISATQGGMNRYPATGRRPVK
jgi:hypothetical protein